MFASQKYLKMCQPARDKLNVVQSQMTVPMKLAAEMNANGHLPYDQCAIDAAWTNWQNDYNAAWITYQKEVAEFDYLKEDYSEETDYSKGQFELVINCPSYLKAFPQDAALAPQFETGDCSDKR